MPSFRQRIKFPIQNMSGQGIIKPSFGPVSPSAPPIPTAPVMNLAAGPGMVNRFKQQTENPYIPHLISALSSRKKGNLYAR